MGYAHVFGLRWWAVFSQTDRYDGITTMDVQETVLVALGDERAAKRGLTEHQVMLNASFYGVGFGGCESEDDTGHECRSDIDNSTRATW